MTPRILLLVLSLTGLPLGQSKVEWRTAKVSWYETGTTTANGERFDPDGLTFAHRTMAFGTQVEFRYHGRSVTARCNDRGPSRKYMDRQFDLSRGAARKLGILKVGVALVQWREVPRG